MIVSASELVETAIPRFGRHETFHPRYGWLKKAFEAPGLDANIFSRPDATVRLGVGKNMVHAIRYWGFAYKILCEAVDPQRPRLPGVVVTEFGKALLGDEGWDPYLELPATLWLLHWQLLTPPCMAPAWWATFHMIDDRPFEEARLVALVSELVETAPGWPEVAPGSIKKDIDCLLRMYSSRGQSRQTIDDLLDCPFRELRLLEPVAGEARAYRFVGGHKATLPDAIVTYAALDFAARTSAGAETITLGRLTHDPGSPGRVFRLTAVSMLGALERAAVDNNRFRIIAPAGNSQLVFSEDPGALAKNLLARHYKGSHALTSGRRGR